MSFYEILLYPIVYRNFIWEHFPMWWLSGTREICVYTTNSGDDTLNPVLRASVCWTFRIQDPSFQTRTHDPPVFKPDWCLFVTMCFINSKFQLITVCCVRFASSPVYSKDLLINLNYAVFLYNMGERSASTKQFSVFEQCLAASSQTDIDPEVRKY